jgi:hypothetical protein
MYVAVRRYDGVSDTQKVARLVDEGFIPIISEMPGFVAYYFVDAGTGSWFRPASSSTRTPRSSPTSGRDSSWQRIWPPAPKPAPGDGG